MNIYVMPNMQPRQVTALLNDTGLDIYIIDGRLRLEPARVCPIVDIHDARLHGCEIRPRIDLEHTPQPA